jgi:uncharacterized protein with HEPN domain
MRRDDRIRLRHMVEAGEAIVEFVSGRAREDLDSDRMLLFAVVRAIEILGEAAAQVSDDTTSELAAIPWRAIVGMRNRIVHAYWDVDTDIVWKTAVEEIPALLPSLREALDRESRGGEP